MPGSAPARQAGGATLGFQEAGGGTANTFTVGQNVQVLDDNQGLQSMSFHPPN